MKFRLPLLKTAATATAVICLLATGTGCTFFRNLGTGARMDQTQARRPTTDNRKRTIVVEVTTDTQGQIASIRFVRSSGKAGIDEYVAQTIRDNWPAQVSQRTIAEITYSQENGFSQPKILSSNPA